MSTYQHKLDLLVNALLAQYHGEPTLEQIAVERKVAVNILAQLGVVP